jgi:hypothetical protein
LNEPQINFSLCLVEQLEVVLPRLGYGWLGSALMALEAITD